jgi:hypothetical protein
MSPNEICSVPGKAITLADSILRDIRGTIYEQHHADLDVQLTASPDARP